MPPLGPLPRRPRLTARLRTVTAAGLCVAALAVGAAANAAPGDRPAADAAPGARAAAAPADDNPLAGRRLGVYKGLADQAWAPYLNAKGQEKALLGRIALTPKSKWFGAWVPDNQIGKKVRDYVSNSQAGDPETLVQMTFFRMVPWEAAVKKRDATEAEAASYRTWVDNAAKAIGSAHVALTLQPDGPLALYQNPATSRATAMINYSARVLSALPNTSVYIEIGASDWPYGRAGVDQVMKFLVPSGVQYARGIALNGTHFTATPLDIQRSADVIEALNQRGITGKKAIINTANSGHPWEFGSYKGPNIADDAPACKKATAPAQRTCVMLGIPPTTDVADPRWGLSATSARLAEKYVDGYIWFGRPWLNYQADPFDKKQALTLARTWQFAGAAGF